MSTSSTGTGLGPGWALPHAPPRSWVTLIDTRPCTSERLEHALSELMAVSGLTRVWRAANVTGAYVNDTERLTKWASWPAGHDHSPAHLLRRPPRTPPSWSAPCLCGSRALGRHPSCEERGPTVRHRAACLLRGCGSPAMCTAPQSSLCRIWPVRVGPVHGRGHSPACSICLGTVPCAPRSCRGSHYSRWPAWKAATNQNQSAFTKEYKPHQGTLVPSVGALQWVAGPRSWRNWVSSLCLGSHRQRVGG